MGIERTKEYQQSLRMRNACNRVLCEVFDVTEDKIVRYERERGGVHTLDKEFAIDLKITTKNGIQFSGQEKALSYAFHKHETFTMEFYQDMECNEPGEFFKIAAQFYLSGYSDETGIEFIQWHIINVFSLMAWLKNYKRSFFEGKCKPAGGSRASFLPIPYAVIPKHCIYAKGSCPGKTEVFCITDRGTTIVLDPKQENFSYNLRKWNGQC